MKRQILATAFLSAIFLSSAQANSSFYGSIQLGVTYGYNHNIVPGNVILQSADGSLFTHPTRYGKRGFDVEDYGSYIGFKGEEKIGNDLSIIYQLEWGFNGAEGGNSGEGFENNVAFIGIQSNFGTLSIGRMDNPFYAAVKGDSEVDQFNAVGTSASMAAAGDVMYGEMGSLNTFDAEMYEYLGKTISYKSPTFSGFSITMATMLSREFENDDGTMLYNKNRGVDLYTVALEYEHDSGFYAKTAFLTADFLKNEKRAYSYGLQLGFNQDNWGINADVASATHKSGYSFGTGNIRSELFWDDVKVGDSNFKHSATGWDIGGHYSFGPDNSSTVRLTYGQASAKKRQSYLGSWDREHNKLTTWALGFEQALSTRTKVWLEYENSKVRQRFSGSYIYENPLSASTTFRSKTFKNDAFSIGIRHDF